MAKTNITPKLKQRKSKMQSTMNEEEAFRSVEKLLYKLAWETTEAYAIPFEEALSECYYGFVKAYNWRYDPTKGTKFSTCVCIIAKWRLRSLVIRRAESLPTVEINEELAGYAPPVHAESLELIDDLSEEAKAMVGLLLEPPAEIVGAPKTTRGKLMPPPPVPVSSLAKRVKEYLVRRGYNKRNVDRAHVELRERFQAAWA